MTIFCGQVAVERVKEFSDLRREAPEFIEPRPPTSWPSKGEPYMVVVPILILTCS